jgi:hypothetical protein
MSKKDKKEKGVRIKKDLPIEWKETCKCPANLKKCNCDKIKQSDK